MEVAIISDSADICSAVSFVKKIIFVFSVSEHQDR
jgi:hypothetical protein